MAKAASQSEIETFATTTTHQTRGRTGPLEL